MEYGFLKNFARRMKNVGLYSLLVLNSSQKQTWKDYGIESPDEELNLIYCILLFVMEQSLKEEACTLDDITVYVDDLNATGFCHPLSYDQCHELSDFVINTILSNGGSPMYFEGFDFESKSMQQIRISYIANRIVYVDGEVRRTSYYLTDDGYNLLLGTLEVEDNLKLSIHEMIFKLHLEKQSYDKALDDVKNIFNLMRIQIQKIQEAMLQIRRNALSYETADYRQILEEDLDTIDSTREKFAGYRETVRKREMELRGMDPARFDEAEKDRLSNLVEIESYLSRAIDEYQRILNGHFDLRSLYSQELEKVSAFTAVQRFPLREKLFDPILDNPEPLWDLNRFLSPLFVRDPEKIFNINKAMQVQSVHYAQAEGESVETEDFDEEEWLREQERLRKEKLTRYEKCLRLILHELAKTGRVTLYQLDLATREDPALRQELLPNVGIFKEIMVELLRAQVLDIDALRRERSEYLIEAPETFELSLMVLNILDEDPKLSGIHRILIYRLKDHSPVVFEHVPAEDGKEKTIRCSNVCLKVEDAQADHEL